jgi:hypothetical protein
MKLAFLLMIAAAMPLAAQVPGSTKAKELKFMRDLTPADSIAIIDAVKARFAKEDSVTSVQLDGSGTTAWVHTMRSNVRTTYTLHKQQGRWVVSDTTLIRVYRSQSGLKVYNAPPRNP